MVRRPLRTAQRFLRFLAFSVTSVRDFHKAVRPHEANGIDARRRAEWTHRHARRLCRILNLTVETVGTAPEAALYGVNHLGYLDIVTLAAATPVVFVSKAEVRGWPILGTLADCGGTLFLQRERKDELREVAQRFEPVIAAGVPVAVFLEGTSSGGDDVLPFRPGLLAPAVASCWAVAPVGLNYEVSTGRVADDVAYWRDDTFVPHFFKLLSHDWIRARVAFGTARLPGEDRKVLARELRDAVVALRRPR
ncbi:MAG TPA: lysophospholipid acyltransferase family protein [Verrucomicrobiota bacterium]|nr:1-acyl-sn-glycerol-3-phosphate acyltransferase [Verrucomicrobiales bacterium]HRI11780.1 lysophospholipid acyltransferase family protein [Verrucomicrobiota bacterium]